MAETKTSGSWNLDGIASKLQAKADELLHSTSSTASKEVTDDETATTGGKREALRNLASTVKGQAEKGLESSKEYLTQVVEKVSTTASEKFAGVKEKGATQFSAASDTANIHYAAVKEKASTQLTGVQTNINKAIAQGQAKATTTTASETTERELPTEEEPLKFPYSIIAWFVSLCHGNSTATTTTTSESTTSTSKDLSDESLHNAAATLIDTFSEGIGSVGNKARTAGEGSTEPTT